MTTSAPELTQKKDALLRAIIVCSEDPVRVSTANEKALEEARAALYECAQSFCFDRSMPFEAPASDLELVLLVEDSILAADGLADRAETNPKKKKQSERIDAMLARGERLIETPGRSAAPVDSIAPGSEQLSTLQTSGLPPYLPHDPDDMPSPEDEDSGSAKKKGKGSKSNLAQIGMAGIGIALVIGAAYMISRRS